MTVSVETLLRECVMVHGRIQLYLHPSGRWQATISHFNGHSTHPLDEQWNDPVDCLRKALMEDARKTADVKRRYERAISERQIDIEDAIAAATVSDDDFMGALG